MGEGEHSGEVTLQGHGPTVAGLGFNPGWSDCRGHLPHHHTILPLCNVLCVSGPVLGRDWQLLLWVPVRGCLHVAALALKPPRPPALPPLTVLLGTSLPLLAGWLAEEAVHYPGTIHSSHAGCSPGSHGVADLPEPQFPLL